MSIPEIFQQVCQRNSWSMDGNQITILLPEGRSQRVAIEAFHERIPDYEITPGQEPVYKPAIREVSYLPLVFPPKS